MRDFGFEFRRPTVEDLSALAATMREADRREVKLWAGQDAEWAVRHSAETSDECWAARFGDGTLACVFGAMRANVVEETAVAWALTSSAVESHRVEFWAGTRAGFDLLCREMPDVGEFVNYVDLGYGAAVRWLERLGAGFSRGVPRATGARGGSFGHFYIENPYYRREE